MSRHLKAAEFVTIAYGTMPGWIRYAQAGRISLAEEELAGGHTIERHVGKSEEYLRTF